MKDDEVYGDDGTSYAFEYRIYDPRLARFLSVDTLSHKYSWQSPYVFCENRVIDGIELEGLERVDNDTYTVDGVVVGAQFTKTFDFSNNPAPINNNANTDVQIDNSGNVQNSTTSSSQPGIGRPGVIARNEINSNGSALQQNGLNQVTQPPNQENTQSTDRLVAEFDNQFNQAYRITSRTGTTPTNVPPMIATNVTNAVNNGNGLVQNIQGNVTRILIITNNSTQATTNAAAEIALLRIAFPNIEIAQATISTHPILNNPPGNGSVVVVFNPTQDFINNRYNPVYTQNWVTPILNTAPIIPLQFPNGTDLILK